MITRLELWNRLKMYVLRACDKKSGYTYASFMLGGFQKNATSFQLQNSWTLNK